MLGIKKEGTQHSIRARITDLVGKEDTERFYQLWRQNHMTRADVDRLAASGFNSIRLPMHYNLFTLPIEEEPVEGQGHVADDRVRDDRQPARLVQGEPHVPDPRPARRARRAGQGRQHLRLRSGRSRRCGRARRTGGRRWRCGESWRSATRASRGSAATTSSTSRTGPSRGRDKNGREDVSNQPIWDLYQADHPGHPRGGHATTSIIVEGNGWGNNYGGFPAPWDRNLVMSFHKYWNPNTEEAIAPFPGAAREVPRAALARRERREHQRVVPRVRGRWSRSTTSAGPGGRTRRSASPRCILTVTPPDDFKKVVDYWNGEGERPSRETRQARPLRAGREPEGRRCRFNADVAQGADSRRRSGRDASHREELRCAIESCAGRAGNPPGQAAANTSKRCCTTSRRRRGASALGRSPGSPACSVSETAGRRLEGLGRRLSPAPSPICRSSALSRSPAPQRLPAGPRRSGPSPAT